MGSELVTVYEVVRRDVHEVMRLRVHEVARFHTRCADQCHQQQLRANMETEDEIYERILLARELDHQFFEHFASEEVDRINQVRAVARRAGRELGWKIRTAQTDPERRSDGKVVVGAVVIDSNPEEEEPIRERGNLLISKMKLPGEESDI